LVVDFDRDRIVDDMGVDMAMDDEDMGSEGEDMGTDEDMGAVDEDMGASVDDMGVEGDAFMCSGAGDCDDSVTCTVDECTGGSCSNTPMDSTCDDSNACTTDSCDMTDDCSNTNVCVLDVSGGALTADDLTTVLTVPSVTAGADGFLVIFEDDGTTELGFAAVSAGTTAAVEVELTRELVDAEMVVVALFEDAGTIGTWEPGTDPQANDGTADVEAMVTVTVPAGTPAVEVTISGDNTDYTFSGARPSTFSTELASLTGADPDITLVRGLRYRFVNTSPGAHPFELLIDNGAGMAGDDVQLVQGATAGTLEATGSLNWVEDGSAVEVTIAIATEFEVIDAYRCGIHTMQMRGGVTYMD
ncbi:MAG: hypothetical protein GWN07_27410, partial [Actinobacteria bacterium]|nr:hypothetical protein [Actinomycetota bacterium]